MFSIPKSGFRNLNIRIVPINTPTPENMETVALFIVEDGNQSAQRLSMQLNIKYILFVAIYLLCKLRNRLLLHCVLISQ